MHESSLFTFNPLSTCLSSLSSSPTLITLISLVSRLTLPSSPLIAHLSILCLSLTHLPIYLLVTHPLSFIIINTASLSLLFQSIGIMVPTSLSLQWYSFYLQLTSLTHQLSLLFHNSLGKHFSYPRIYSFLTFNNL